jgi:hypothetical protein
MAVKHSQPILNAGPPISSDWRARSRSARGLMLRGSRRKRRYASFQSHLVQMLPAGEFGIAPRLPDAEKGPALQVRGAGPDRC